MQAGFQHIVRSSPATVFTEALAAGASSALYNIPVGGQTGVGDSVFKGVSIIATQVCAYEIDLFNSGIGQPSATVAGDLWIGSWTFAEASFQQFGGAGLWRANIYGIDLPYRDYDFNNAFTEVTIHAVLTNRSAINAKSAGAPGALMVAFFLEPVGVTNL